MDRKALWQKYNTLPKEAQEQVESFLGWLTARYNQALPARRTRKSNLNEEPFVGMWRDRQDLADSTAWVRSMRKKEWLR